MTCREALHFVNKILTGENFSFKLTINFSFNFLTSKINYMYSSLIQNPAVSFKLHMTKICYCLPPIFLFLFYSKITSVFWISSEC